MGVASNNVMVRAKALEAQSTDTRPVPVKWAEEDLNKATKEGRVKIIYDETAAADTKY